MKQAVITTGGKQYLVREGAQVRVDRLAAAAGEKVTFNEVLLAYSGSKLSVGQPTVAGASVSGEVVAQARAAKVFGVKMKAKKRHKKLFGHKQHYTEVRIKKIETGK